MYNCFRGPQLSFRRGLARLFDVDQLYPVTLEQPASKCAAAVSDTGECAQRAGCVTVGSLLCRAALLPAGGPAACGFVWYLRRCTASATAGGRHGIRMVLRTVFRCFSRVMDVWKRGISPTSGAAPVDRLYGGAVPVCGNNTFLFVQYGQLLAFIVRVAMAMPDHKALCVSLFRRVLRSQPAETSASNVSESIVLYTFAAAMGLAPGHQFCRRGFAGIAADAQACPVCAHLGALPAASDHFQLPKGLTPNKSCAVACRARSMRRQPQRWEPPCCNDRSSTYRSVPQSYRHRYFRSPCGVVMCPSSTVQRPNR